MCATSAAQLVAVGVDESSAAAAAARYAATVARDRGWDLMLLHSYQASSRGGRRRAVQRSRSREEAQAVLDRVLEGLMVGDRVRVHEVLTPESAVAGLREVSGYVALLVLGRRDADRGVEVLTGRVGPAVAAAARCPVAMVPDGWTEAVGADRPVVLALDPETPTGPALACALEEARFRGSGLVVLRAVPGGPDESSDPDAERALAALLEEAREAHPDVAVRLLTVEGDVRARVRTEPVRAGVVVVGRPHQGRHVGPWAQEAARAVVEGSRCPLLVAPSDDDSGQTSS